MTSDVTMAHCRTTDGRAYAPRGNVTATITLPSVADKRTGSVPYSSLGLACGIVRAEARMTRLWACLAAARKIFK